MQGVSENNIKLGLGVQRSRNRGNKTQEVDMAGITSARVKEDMNLWVLKEA